MRTDRTGTRAQKLIPIVLLCSACCPIPLEARQSDSTRTAYFSLLPIVFSSPDTGFGFGVLPQVIFGRSANRRSSVVRSDLFRTTRGQTHLSLTSRVWTPGNRFGIRASVRYRDWPSTYHGLTDALDDVPGLPVHERKTRVDLEVIRRMNRLMYVGIGSEVRVFRVYETDEDDVSAYILPLEKARVAGLRLIFVLDNRDAVVFPAGGQEIRMETRFHPVLGEDFDGFTTGRLSARSFHAFSGRAVLAVEGVFHVSTGSTPYFVMPGVGSVIRGYSSTRLRHRNLLASQVEIRLSPIVWRLGCVLFAGAGRVADDIPGLFAGGMHPAAGAGLRLILVRTERLHVRWDFAFGRGAGGDYLDLGEAF